MTESGEQFVSKVHPATRPVEPEDPMSLHAVEIPGDVELMLSCLVEEYSRMGFGTEELMALCRDPFYHAAHGLWKHFGEAELRRRIDAVLSRSGVLRIRATVSSPPPDDLIQIEQPNATQED